MKSKIKKTVSIMITVLMVFIILPNASASAKGIEKNAKIKLWVPDAECGIAKKAVKQFAKKYKKKKIKITVKAYSEPDASTMLLSDMESAADVCAVGSSDLTQLVKAKCIKTIKNSYAKKIKKSEAEKAVSAFKLKKKLYAFPRAAQSYCLVYDKSVVSPAQAKTFEGVLEACKDKNKKFIMDAGNGYYSCMFLFTGGLRFKGLKNDGVTQKFNNYNRNEIVAAIKAFSILMHKYNGTFKSLAVSNIPADFTSTKTKKATCGAGIDGLWDYSVNKHALGDNFGAAKLPTIKIGEKDRQIYNMFGYTGYVIKKGTKYPKAAQALASYISGKTYQKKRIKKNIMPVNKSLLRSDTVNNHPMLNALAQQQKYSVAQANLSMFIWDPMGNMGNKIVSKKTNPETFDFNNLVKKTIKNMQDL